MNAGYGTRWHVWSNAASIDAQQNSEVLPHLYSLHHSVVSVIWICVYVSMV
jgi:hypothetical protein